MTNTNTDQPTEDSGTDTNKTTFVVEHTPGSIGLMTHVTASDRSEAIRKFVDDATHHAPSNIEGDSVIKTHITMGSCPVQLTIDTDDLVAYPEKDSASDGW
jgi:hypothetical protein